MDVPLLLASVLILLASLWPTLSFQSSKDALSSSDLVACKIEVTLGNFSSPNKYAGTADLIAQYEGKICILDFKQSNKIKKVDYIQDFFLQLGAYTLAHDVVYDTKIKAGIILLCTVDIFFQEFKIEETELEMYQNLFLGRLKKFNEMNNISWLLFTNS